MNRVSSVLSLALALLLGSCAASDLDFRYNAADDGTATYVEIDKSGDIILTMRNGTRLATVTLTVSADSQPWPGGLLVGGNRQEDESPDRPYMIITDAKIMVDNCWVDQPWPPVGGFARPGGATLSAVDEHWQLEIHGGDGAESYGVYYLFDEHRVLKRQLGWGPLYDETTHYDMITYQDELPQACGDDIG